MKDAKYAGMKEPPPPVFQTPIAQAARWNFVVFYARTALDPEHTPEWPRPRKFVQSFLFGMKSLDAAVYALAACLLWLIAMAAACLPARRATSVDPMVALRYE